MPKSSSVRSLITPHDQTLCTGVIAQRFMWILVVLLWCCGCEQKAPDNVPATISPSPFQGVPTAHDPCEIILPDHYQRSEKTRRDELDEIRRGVRRVLRSDASRDDFNELLSLKNQLVHLKISRPMLAPEEFEVVSHLHGLESLNLSGCDVDDADLLAMKPCLTNLKLLWMTRCPISDVSMRLLVSIEPLVTLGLSSTAITDAGMGELGKKGNLEQLNISSTAITDHGVASLGGLTSLKTLSIGTNPKLTNAAIAGLTGLKNLTSIQLDNTAIDEGCLDDLAECTNLRFVVESWTLKDPAARERLQAKLPKFGKIDDLFEPITWPKFTRYRFECIDCWTYTKLHAIPKATEVIREITRNVDLPADATEIYAAEGPGFYQDSKNFLMFKTTLDGATRFAKQMVDKAPADMNTLDRSGLAHAHCYGHLTKNGFPWNAEKVRNGRFSQLPMSSGHLFIDMDNWGVYVKR